MRPLTARLEDGYCSITVANRLLMTVIIFVVKSYTHSWKDFANKLRLVLHTYDIFFSEIVLLVLLNQTGPMIRHGAVILRSAQLCPDPEWWPGWWLQRDQRQIMPRARVPFAFRRFVVHRANMVVRAACAIRTVRHGATEAPTCAGLNATAITFRFPNFYILRPAACHLLPTSSVR